MHERKPSAANSNWCMWATPFSCSVDSTPSADNPASYVPCTASHIVRSCSTTTRVAARSASRRSGGTDGCQSTPARRRVVDGPVGVNRNVAAKPAKHEIAVFGNSAK